MKVRRFSSFFSFTKAPDTGCPDASLMTPETVPLFWADVIDETAISAALAAMPAARLLVTFVSGIELPPYDLYGNSNETCPALFCGYAGLTRVTRCGRLAQL